MPVIVTILYRIICVQPNFPSLSAPGPARANAVFAVGVYIVHFRSISGLRPSTRTVMISYTTVLVGTLLHHRPVGVWRYCDKNKRKENNKKKNRNLASACVAGISLSVDTEINERKRNQCVTSTYCDTHVRIKRLGRINVQADSVGRLPRTRRRISKVAKYHWLIVRFYAEHSTLEISRLFRCVYMHATVTNTGDPCSIRISQLKILCSFFFCL